MLILLENGSLQSNLKDSNLLIKVSINDACSVIEIEDDSSLESIDDDDLRSAYFKATFNVLFMFQSVENSNRTGSKTAHISIDDFHATTAGGLYPTETKSPFISPTSAEIRSFYDIVDGKVVSQDYSYHCNTLNMSLSPEDIKILSLLVKDLSSGSCTQETEF